jgi:hypothetical protein
LTSLRAIHQTALFSGICLLAVVPTLNSSERLALRVSPSVAFAPAALTVSVTVAADEQNRALQVIAESSDFYRSSEIPLEGRNAPALSVFTFRDLPPGLYSMTGILTGANGTLATTQRVAKVQPSVGSSR